MTNPIPMNQQVAALLEDQQGPRDFAKPAVDDLTKRAGEIADDISVGKETLRQQWADIKAFDREVAARRAEMVARYNSDKAEQDVRVNVLAGIHRALADIAALQRLTSEAPADPKPSTPKRSRAKGKVERKAAAE